MRVVIKKLWCVLHHLWMVPKSIPLQKKTKAPTVVKKLTTLPSVNQVKLMLKWKRINSLVLPIFWPVFLNLRLVNLTESI